MWVRELYEVLLQREEQGHRDDLIQEMGLKEHFKYFRMLPSTLFTIF